MQVGIIGIGHMGQAIIDGLLNKIDPNEFILAAHRTNDAMQTYHDELGLQITTDYQDVLDAAPEFLIFTTPAPLTLDVMAQFKGLDPKVTILSAAGGVPLADIQKKFPQNPVALLMPNTPVAINHGTLGVSMGSQVTDGVKIETFLALLGDVFTVSAEEFGIFGTITGCGPAFVDVFMAALADAGVKNGLGRELAYQAAASMVKGSASLLQESGLTPDVLKDQVTTPGGSTIRGVVALEKHAFRSAVIDAVDASNN
ncbi:pyrroline-5-carboxylate reductase [Weissella viridescens]|uniref:Pyrroline-5-carboxylate reductase n=1 Tax=Weissella viridescens TaxID=1629 RepID=A0A3P2RG32_WEIVI|nr:pyrroline-5-carboxylate reductase [Weissella viridescens]RRG17780.1 pyrroline-5-carboxylate reductase [Weissella viridescens]